MKILLVTSQASFTDQFKKALEANGSEVFYFDDRENMILPPLLKNNKFLWRVSRKIHPLRRLSNRILGRKLVATARELKPDLVLFNKAMVIKKDTLAHLNSMGIKTANWFLDNVQIKPYANWFLKNYNSYDFLLIFDSYAKDLMKDKQDSSRIKYLPMAVDPNAYKFEGLSEDDRNKYSCDVCFVGALYPERERILNIIQKMGVTLKIYGWKGWEKTSLAPNYFGPLNTKETVKLYNCAKICLNMNTTPPVSGVNFKTFEISAAGGFQLSDYRKDVEALFVVGKEIEIFHNDQELKEKINFYLKNLELAGSIVEAAKIRIIHDHTLKKRAAEILRIIGVGSAS